MITVEQNILILCLFILLIMIIYFIIKNRNENVVMDNSLMCNKLIELTESLNFNNVKKRHKFHDSHTTKRKFDKDTTQKFMSRHIYENYSYYTQILLEAKENEYNYSRFLRSYIELEKVIGKSHSNKMNNDKFVKIEKRLYRRGKIREPRTEFIIKYSVSYTSPKGRNHYIKKDIFDSYIIDVELKKIQEQIKAKNTRQYVIKQERSKMTNSLRYDVMQRDNFRCQICGSNQSDGVKLHVDHIVPVSKGGRTMINNLRTLCDRCNLGKSDKM